MPLGSASGSHDAAKGGALFGGPVDVLLGHPEASKLGSEGLQLRLHLLPLGLEARRLLLLLRRGPPPRIVESPAPLDSSCQDRESFAFCTDAAATAPAICGIAASLGCLSV